MKNSPVSCALGACTLGASLNRAGIITAALKEKVMAGRNQRKEANGKRGKSNSGIRKRHTGGGPSINQESNEIVNRNAEPTGKSNSLRADERNFDIVVDDVPYFIKAAAFRFNEETRFTVTVNDGPEHIFTWDSDVRALRAIDDESSIMPDSLEEAISQRLQSRER
jgi:hypothetical protein